MRDPFRALIKREVALLDGSPHKGLPPALAQEQYDLRLPTGRRQPPLHRQPAVVVARQPPPNASAPGALHGPVLDEMDIESIEARAVIDGCCDERCDDQSGIRSMRWLWAHGHTQGGLNDASSACRAPPLLTHCYLHRSFDRLCKGETQQSVVVCLPRIHGKGVVLSCVEF